MNYTFLINNTQDLSFKSCDWYIEHQIVSDLINSGDVIPIYWSYIVLIIGIFFGVLFYYLYMRYLK